MNIEKELNLLGDYLKYCIDLNFQKERYLMQKRFYDGKGPSPRLDVRSERELEPLSFKDWIKYNKNNLVNLKKST